MDTSKLTCDEMKAILGGLPEAPEGFGFTGEYRPSKDGEWHLWFYGPNDSHPKQGSTVSFHLILRKIEPEYVNGEVWTDGQGNCGVRAGCQWLDFGGAATSHFKPLRQASNGEVGEYVEGYTPTPRIGRVFVERFADQYGDK